MITTRSDNDSFDASSITTTSDNFSLLSYAIMQNNNVAFLSLYYGITLAGMTFPLSKRVKVNSATSDCPMFFIFLRFHREALSAVSVQDGQDGLYPSHTQRGGLLTRGRARPIVHRGRERAGGGGGGGCRQNSPVWHKSYKTVADYEINRSE